MNNLPVLLFLAFRWLDLLDIFLVAVLIYQLYRLVKGTAALNIFIGIAFFYVFYIVVDLMRLELFSTILGEFINVGVIALLIVFQPELRRFFLFVGSYNVVTNQKFRKALFSWKTPSKTTGTDVGAVVKACRNMSESKTGAIIVFTRGNDLSFYANTGDPVDARISVRMLESIFFKNSPLHDGAVLITGNTIRAARCVLPVTENDDFPAHLGMRHRAAVGITENTDAIAIVVSEQTGEISVSMEGEMQNNITPEQLRNILEKKLDN
ncbi:MAG TPA: diadenylate cyclase CdaA [Bacteroidia bacterium]|nr:diadenylate cyclase CdaA [Bacteroidia bacterium]